MPRNTIPKLKELTADELFFYSNAGYSYNTEKEGAEDGHRRCARSLALAERTAKSLGVEFEWRYEEEPCDCEEKDHECLYCVARHEGKVVASLGMICGADDNYRRVVEAELADEAVDTIRARGAEVNA